MVNRTNERVEFLKDILITAIEGGITYWAEVLSYEPDYGEATVYDVGEELIYPITLDIIEKGITILTTGENAGKSFCLGGMDYWQQFLLANLTNGEHGDYDADIADNIVQAGTMGEIVYG